MCPSTHLCIYLPIYSSIYLSVYLSINLNLSIYLTVYLSTHPSIYPLINQLSCLFLYQYRRLLILPSIESYFCLFPYISSLLSVCLSFRPLINFPCPQVSDSHHGFLTTSPASFLLTTQTKMTHRSRI